MYNLPKFDSEKAAKNLNKTYKNPMISIVARITRVLKNVAEAISTGGQTGPHTLRLITEGVDKPDFQMTQIAGYITTNGIHAACKKLE